MPNITIDAKNIEIIESKTIFQVAQEASVYIPHLCYHPQLNPTLEVQSLKRVYQGGVARSGEEGEGFAGCNLCLVEIQGRLVQSCKTMAEDGMIVTADSPDVIKARRDALASIFEHHPHACLLCPQAQGCDRKVCSVNIPEDERCCSQFGSCELRKVAGFIGMDEGLPPYKPSPISLVDNEPLILRDYNLCIGCLRCVRVCRALRGADALGFSIVDGRVAVGRRQPGFKESGCQSCGFCVEVCPTGALTDKTADVGKRETYLIPCKNTCPAEIDVPRYVRFIKEKEFEKALSAICEKVPFPETLGRVCFHPCETRCRRGSLDQPVAICALKRFAASYGEKVCTHLEFSAGNKTEKKVAVIGSGPAGLTAAYYLNILGHSATIFESLPEAGGMLRVGIPSFRLPKDILEREIKRIEDVGVEIKTDHHIHSAEELFLKGFDAIFLSIGAHKGLNLGIPGEKSPGIIDGISFLKDVNLEREVKAGKSVAIIGGGNVAVDSARSIRRLGSKEVTIFYRRTREEMPAYDEEIAAALEEGIKIGYQTAPKRIEKLNGALEIEFIRMKMEETDASKRPRPVPIEGSEYKLKFETLIPAIGQRPEIPEGFDISYYGDNKMKINPSKGIFLGGDCLTGPKTVIDAIAGGRKGASLIDKYLGGDGNITQRFTGDDKPRFWSGPDAIPIDQARALMPMLPAEQRASGFSEVSLGFNDQAAVQEAGRCLECDLRFQIKPVVLPPEKWLVLSEENIQEIPETEGVYVLYDEQKAVYQITGVENIRQELMQEFEKGSEASRYFSYEEDQMFTSKERQLIQQYMKEYGKMPPGNEEMDELF